MRKVIYFFSKLRDQDVDWLLSAGQKKSVPKGQVIVEAGKNLENLYLTVKGRFDVLRGNSKIAGIGSGEFVGELSLLESISPNVSVAAVEDSVLLSFNLNRIRSKLKVDADFASRFYHAISLVLASRMRQTVRTLGVTDERILDDDVESDGEIPLDELDESDLASARFERLRTIVLND